MAKGPLGRFTWYQVNATDVDAARDFYTDVAGWHAEKLPMQDGSEYTEFYAGKIPVGGIMAMPDEAKQGGAPQHWLSYISTPKVDDTVAKARELGAQVFVPPTDIPDVGRFAVLGDPQGAAFAMFTPADPPEDTPFEPALGEISWHELMTTDYKAAFAFYSTLFGWQKREAMDMGEGNIYQLFGRHDRDLGGMWNKPDDMPAPPNWLLYIRVADVAERVERIKTLGGQLLNGPMEVPGGDLIAQCIDPQGGAFAIHATAS